MKARFPTSLRIWESEPLIDYDYSIPSSEVLSLRTFGKDRPDRIHDTPNAIAHWEGETRSHLLTLKRDRSDVYIYWT